jgi:phospholipid/cholesterol/gamma-HCH transport system ATP-binding protein
MADEFPIRLVGLHKSFGPQIVLDGVSLDIARGKTTVVMGPSGTGKSVLLKHIVGLMRPDKGEVLLEGRRISDLPERELLRVRTRFGFLFQLAALFDSMSVYDNVAFPIRQHTDKPESEVARIVREKLAMVGLSGIEGRNPADLSGGMKKRVALARAIALDPEIILYDEPTTGLDPLRSDVINTLINRLKERMKVTSVVVTHDLPCVAKVADRVVMLRAGRIVFDGTHAQLLETKDPEISRFIRGEASEEDLAALG